jgi:hypothetical protein
MKYKWIGLPVVAAAVIGIIWYKNHLAPAPPAANSTALPQILLVADLSEVDSDEGCGKIIHSVREARQRGVRVAELSPDRQSELISRYHILTAPTLVILDDSGNVVQRFEGEDARTVSAVQEAVAALRKEN